jgi:hypothetical protein
VARSLAVSEQVLRRRLEKGEIQPDATANLGGFRPAQPLFNESSLPRLRQQLFQKPVETQL